MVALGVYEKLTSLSKKFINGRVSLVIDGLTMRLFIYSKTKHYRSMVNFGTKSEQAIYHFCNIFSFQLGIIFVISLPHCTYQFSQFRSSDKYLHCVYSIRKIKQICYQITENIYPQELLPNMNEPKRALTFSANTIYVGIAIEANYNQCLFFFTDFSLH